MTPIEREPPMDAAFDLAIARCTVAAGLSFACATVSDQLAPATQNALERLLDHRERSVYQTIADPSDRRCYAAARGLLRIELSQHLALPAQDWEYVPKPGHPTEIRTPLGRLDTFRYSLSHTRGLVACAVSDLSGGVYGEVGIDVEWIRPLAQMEDLAQAHFAGTEVAAMRALPPAERPKRFFSLWALRQAWAKARRAHGQPDDPPREAALYTFDETGNVLRATFAAGLKEPGSQWHFWLHALDDAHVLALAARERQLLT
jgi:4'-phosphopantetheinyl transferase